MESEGSERFWWNVTFDTVRIMILEVRRFSVKEKLKAKFVLTCECTLLCEMSRWCERILNCENRPTNRNSNCRRTIHSSCVPNPLIVYEPLPDFFCSLNHHHIYNLVSEILFESVVIVCNFHSAIKSEPQIFYREDNQRESWQERRVAQSQPRLRRPRRP